MDGDVATFAGTDDPALLPRDCALTIAGRHADGGVVLLGTVDAIGSPVVGGDVVELGGHLVVDGRPGLAAVEGNARAAIVALNHAERIAGVDPEVMVVIVGGGDLEEVGAAVD